MPHQQAAGVHCITACLVITELICCRFDEARQERVQKYEGMNLYIKNLTDEVDDAELRSEFQPFGTITSAKVMHSSQGKSKGFGFVCYSSSEEATRAVTEMSGRMLHDKPLYVALAQRSEQRKAQLQQQYQQPRGMMGPPMGGPMGAMGPTMPGMNGPMPMYPGAVPPYMQGPGPRGMGPRGYPRGPPGPMMYPPMMPQVSFCIICLITMFCCFYSFKFCFKCLTHKTMANCCIFQLQCLPAVLMIVQKMQLSFLKTVVHLSCADAANGRQRQSATHGSL